MKIEAVCAKCGKKFHRERKCIIHRLTAGKPVYCSHQCSWVESVKARKERYAMHSYSHLLNDFQYEKFWKSIRKTRNGGCWEWTGHTNINGYGVVNIGYKKMMAHRVSWILEYGDIPAHEDYHGMCVCHKCDNPKCVNPSHLFLGTNQDNVTDMVSKDRHTRGERNGCAKLSETDVREIRCLSEKGLSSTRLAFMYQMSDAQILRIIRRERWQHVL